MTERRVEDLGAMPDVVGDAKALVDLAHCADTAVAMRTLADAVMSQRERTLEATSNINGDYPVKSRQMTPTGFFMQWKSSDGRLLCTRVMDGGSQVTFVDTVWGGLRRCEAVFRDNSGLGSAEIEFSEGKVTNVQVSVITCDSARAQVPGA